MKNKVLFISHYAGRTGAPLLLLNLLKWLKESTDLAFEILLLADGPLHSEFSQLAPVHLFPAEGFPPKETSLSLTQKLGLAKAPVNNFTRLLNQLRENGISLIYANTVVTGKALEALAPLGCPVITHIHELDYWIEQSGEKNLEQVRTHTRNYIAASGAVKKNLVAKYNIPAEIIEVVHSFIPTDGVVADPIGIRKKLGIPDDAFIVLGSGHETWRKGKDLFVQLAALTVKNHPDIQTHFLWVGGWQKEEDRRNILHDVQHLGLINRIHFTEEVNNPLDYFAAGDVFAMVSREDPFPLVCLEAALLKKPVLCFADAGGMPEFVEMDAGVIIPYLDLQEMTKTIRMLACDKELCRNLGCKAKFKVEKLHSLDSGGKRIAELITVFQASGEVSSVLNRCEKNK
jgi:glycosyltransferase involved in cell wall biosynthesis